MKHPVTPDQLLEHAASMRALALRLVRDEDAADDLVQETMLAAMERPPDDPTATASWLRRVLRHFAYRRWNERRRRRRRELAAAHPEATDATPDRVLERVELQHRVVELVLALEEPYRSTVLLRFFEGLDTREIAARHRVDASTVRWRLRAALARLRRRLDRDHGGREAWCSVLLPLSWSPGPLPGSGDSLAPPGAAVSVPSSAGGALTGALLAGVTAMKVKLAVIAAAVLSILALGLIVTSTWDPGNDAPPDALRAAAPEVAVPESSPRVPAPAAERLAGESQPGDADPPLPPAPEGPIVIGVVVDGETGDPLPGALLRVRGGEHRTEADDEGVYEFAGLPAGDWFLIASAEDHAESHARVHLESAGEFWRDFALDPAIEALITVVDTNGAPIDGVTVTRSQPAGDYIHSDEYSRTTDAAGQALLPGINLLAPQQLHAKKTGYRETWWKDYRFDADAGFAEGTIVLQEAPGLERVLEGTVSDARAAPLAAVSVQWIHSWGESKGREVAVTDRQGRYRLSFESETETHPISVFGDGFAPLIREGVKTGTRESPARLDFTLEAGHWLAGRVVDEEGRPVEGARVRAMPELGSLRNPNIQPGIARIATTGAEGRFELADLPAPTVAIRLRGPAGDEWSNNVTEDVPVDGEVELTLLRWSVIRGRVVDDDTGEAVPAFRIALEGGGKGYLEYPRMNPGESFDTPDGAFVLAKLDRDTYDLTVRAEGYLSTRLEDVAAVAPEEAQALEVRISRGRAVEGVVVDAASGLPVGGATIVFGEWRWDHLTWNGWNLENMYNARELVTGPDGAFRLLEKAPGTMFIRAAGHARLCVPPEDRARFDLGTGRLALPLSAEAVLSGVHLQDGRPCRTGFLVPIFLRDGTGEGGGMAREWLEGVDRDDDGRFRIEGLAPGAYWLDHYRETPGKVAAGMATRRRVVLGPGETAIEHGKDLGDLVFSGRLLDSAGEPLDRVYLHLVPAREAPAGDEQWVHFSSSVEAKHGGRFWIGGLTPGRYRVEVELRRGGDPLPLSPIELAESTERDLVLPAK